MDTSKMLHQMCHNVLSNADVKAICKSRGFSAKEAGSRALFENFFLSDIGLEKALSTLTGEEVTLLHLLKFLGEIVDVSAFARIYRQEGQYYYGSFNQRYKEVFKKVKLSLIRKGLLLMAEANMLSAKSKMERWRFRFPREFESFLPPLISEARSFEQPGNLRSQVLRRKLMEFAEGEQSSPLGKEEAQAYKLSLVDGVLRIGERPFRERHLLEWQQACWEAAIPAPEPETKDWRIRNELTVPTVDATRYIFAQLGEKEWIRPAQLSLPLKIFGNAALDGEKICQIGWHWGCLARQKEGEVSYYRLPGKIGRPEPDPQYYLHTPPDRPLVVKLEAIPYRTLEQLAQIADLEVTNAGRAFPAAVPSVIKMGHALAAMQDQPLIHWLRENAPAFRRAFELVRRRWGKQVVHQGLMIAKVNDLTLKVQLERAFSDPKKMIFLPNDYLAFPRDLLTAVEKAVAKSGHIIKRVQQSQTGRHRE